MVAGIFFDDESFTINTYSTEVEWIDSVRQMPEFLGLEAWKSANFSVKSGPNHDRFQVAMEKGSQTGKRCRYLHQTDFISRILRSQKIRISEGFCEDNLLLQMSERNSHGKGRSTMLTIPIHAPPGQADNSYLPTKINGDCCSDTPPAVIKADIQFQQKSGCCQERLHPLINYLDLYLSISSRILNSCSCSSGVLAERNS